MQTTTDAAHVDEQNVSGRPDAGPFSPGALGLNGVILIISHISLFVLGILVSLALVLLLGRDPAGTTRTASSPQVGNIVLVVTTATPSPAQAQAPQVAQSTAAVTEVMPDTSVSETLAGARDYTRLGPASAPVQIVVFADPQCPFCRQLMLGPERQVITDYVKTGKAAITYRHYAFLGAESTRAAEAMECAGKQGSQAFWDFHDQIFENQFPENSGQLTDAKLLEWAGSAGLDTSKLSACLLSGESKAIVDADMKAAAALSVSGTPVTFVTGRRLVGAVPYDFIKTAIDAELTAGK